MKSFPLSISFHAVFVAEAKPVTLKSSANLVGQSLSRGCSGLQVGKLTQKRTNVVVGKLTQKRTNVVSSTRPMKIQHGII